MIWHLSTPSVTEVWVALYSFGDIFLSISPLLITIGAAIALELDSETVDGAEADGDDNVVCEARTSCWSMDSIRSIRSVTVSDDAGADDGVITGSWPIASSLRASTAEGGWHARGISGVGITGIHADVAQSEDSGEREWFSFYGWFIELAHSLPCHEIHT